MKKYSLFIPYLIVLIASCEKNVIPDKKETELLQTNYNDSLVIKNIDLSSQIQTNDKVPLSENLCPQNSFTDYQSFHDELNLVRYMDDVDRIEYEKSKGYLSFYSQCEAFYNSIDFESFNALEEIFDFVNRHKKYLVLIEEDNGDYTVETNVIDNPSAYLVDTNGIVEIAGKTYILNKEGLNNSITNEPLVVHFFPERANSSTKQNWCDWHPDEVDEVRDKNKTVAGFLCTLGLPNGNTIVEADAWVKSYKKTLVWIRANRSLSLQASALLKFKVENENEKRAEGNKYGTKHGSKLEIKIFYEEVQSKYDYNQVEYYDLWEYFVRGDTPSTDPAILRCDGW